MYFQENVSFTSATSRLERTPQTLVLTKDFAWDKIKVIPEQTSQLTFSNREDLGQFHHHTSKIVLPVTDLRLTITTTIWNTRTSKVAKTLVTAGISRHCCWKARFYLSGKSSKIRKRKHVLLTKEERRTLFEEKEIRPKAVSLSKARKSILKKCTVR